MEEPDAAVHRDRFDRAGQPGTEPHRPSSRHFRLRSRSSRWRDSWPRPRRQTSDASGSVSAAADPHVGQSAAGCADSRGRLDSRTDRRTGELGKIRTPPAAPSGAAGSCSIQPPKLFEKPKPGHHSMRPRPLLMPSAMSRSAHRVFRAISAPFAGGACGGNGSRIGAEGAAVAPKRAHKTLMNSGSVCPFGACKSHFAPSRAPLVRAQARLVRF